MRSSIDRIITGYGYSTAIGIKHCSATNRFNFSCDIMEPFRPFVDMVVFQHGNTELTWDYKKILIDILQSNCIYNKCRMTLDNAIECYFLDLRDFLSGNDWKVGDIEFDR